MQHLTFWFLGCPCHTFPYAHTHMCCKYSVSVCEGLLHEKFLHVHVRMFLSLHITRWFSVHSSYQHFSPILALSPCGGRFLTCSYQIWILWADPTDKLHQAICNQDLASNLQCRITQSYKLKSYFILASEFINRLNWWLHPKCFQTT